MKQFQRFLFCSIALISLSGCGEKSPEGFPVNVYPSTVTVTKGGEKLANVSVYFDLETPQNWNIGGVTDTNGIAVIRTTQSAFQKNGAPEGTYQVRLSEEMPVMPDELSDTQFMALTPAERMAYEKKKDAFIEAHRKIPRKYTGRTNTPISITVSASAPNELTIDTAK
jgi:predicted small lipoprotein YifL